MDLGLRRFRLSLAILLIVGAAQVSEAGIKSERLLAAILRHTPSPRLVAEGEQLKQAEAVAASVPGAQALWGVGSSMEPLYASNTAVVVTAIDFEAIRKGMTVVYLKRNGRRVAHSVVGETRGGFIVQGINNDQEDAELVTSENYIGVITEAYASADSAFRSDLTRRLTSKPADRGVGRG
ncbi:MAG: hypothetical protein JNG83_04400 [Opitutaceae bacterium]|nr:hypothetical protein [Opitutaceae bacterium]